MNKLLRIGVLATLSIVLMNVTYAIDQQYLIDFVILNEGKTQADRADYERKIDPIIRKHGIEKTQSYEMVNFLGGQLEGASKLNIYKMDADSFNYLGSDSEFAKLNKLRSEVHDMSKLTLYTAEALLDYGQINSPLVLVDVVAMNDGYGHTERFEYESKIQEIASKYNMSLRNSFDIDSKIAGIGPDDALKVNLWSLPSGEVMQKLSSDPDYLSLEKQRNRLHDFSALSLYIAEPAAH